MEWQEKLGREKFEKKTKLKVAVHLKTAQKQQSTVWELWKREAGKITTQNEIEMQMQTLFQYIKSSWTHAEPQFSVLYLHAARQLD